jgi:hypothetical protein
LTLLGFQDFDSFRRGNAIERAEELRSNAFLSLQSGETVSLQGTGSRRKSYDFRYSFHALNLAAKDLTTNLEVACRTGSAHQAARFMRLACFIFLVAAGLQTAFGQGGPASGTDLNAGKRSVRTATIHWQDVPLRDALIRLEKLFGKSAFLDRRIDPTVRVNLDMAASSVEQVLARVGGEHGWGVSRVGDVVYLGPAAAAGQLSGIIAARKEDVAKLPQAQRANFMRKWAISWPRLTKPRELVTELVKKTGWRNTDEQRIPHDLWAAGRLDGLTFAEQLAVLLVGFDLTYEIRAETRTIQIVKLDQSAYIALADSAADPPAGKSPERTDGKTKQVYSLRVAEKPVGPVLRELARRLNWQIEFDDAAIQAAGRSLEARVSFAVENVEQDELLDAVLGPAGLTFRREGEVIEVVPRK